MTHVKPLPIEALYRRADLSRSDFETTDQLKDPPGIIGQPRAVEAVQFGIGVERQGYNIFALGSVGVGKHSIVGQFFEQRAANEPVPADWCYVHNFKEPHKPQALCLPPGKGAELRGDMAQLVEALRTDLSAAFDSEEYRTRRQVIEEEFKERQESAFKQVQQQGQERGLALLQTPSGLAMAPVRDGQVLSPEDVQKLSQEERQRMEADVEQLQDALQKAVQQFPRWQREMRDKVKALDGEIASAAISGHIDELRTKYAGVATVEGYLSAVRQDVIDHVQDFLPQEEAHPPAMLSEAGDDATLIRAELPLSRRYQVNILVDHSNAKGAPVIYEDNPTYQNLVGRVEHIAQMGALLTDFSLIKPGALHRANGGYLLLDARKVLVQPYTWEELKRALQARQIQIGALGQMLSLVSTISLEPELIPLDVKVALLGDPVLYYALYEADPDFDELFKVQADFEDEMERTPENQGLYANLIGSMIRSAGLRPFDREAVARIIEHSSRLAGDADKLSTRMRDIANLVSEADYWAGQAGRDVAGAADVQRAIDAQVHRSDRVRERLRENILRGTILIDTEGSKVGQVNGLSVLQLGNYSFGQPNRITARVRLGKGEVVDIEREVELGGPIHSKGVLILSGFLGARYAVDRPLSLSASLVFEQSYSGVEGDSASSAELYALLSAIAEVPIKQSLAVTGSVNQHGQVQAIGGVNEKIEGFFDVCRARGLTGEQGVLIPASNVKHLMLRHDIVEAAAAGQFQIYAVETIDQGIELLTGLPAGERNKAGSYPKGSINGRVEARLADLAKKRADLAKEQEA
ncbi:MAG: AAA family ATPase [Anaerolineae bacterium]|nr:AAA family ATPase [Anaerolineae bacterium]